MKSTQMTSKSPSMNYYVDQISDNTIKPSSIKLSSVTPAESTYDVLVRQVDQSIAKLNELLEASIARDLEDAVRNVGNVLGIDLGDLTVSVEITMVNKGDVGPTANIGSRKYRIALDFDRASTLPRRHKVTLFKAAMKRNPTLESIDSDISTAVDYVLDQCMIVRNTVTT